MRPAEKESWLALARDSPAATFFHTPFWAEAAAAAGAGNPAAAAGELADGTPWVYPLLEVPPGTRIYRSTFAGCYGGPIAARALEPGEARAIHELVIADRTEALQATLGPAQPEGGVPPGWEARPDSTLVVDLEGDFDAVLGRYTKGHRRAYKRGMKEGVSVRQAETEADVDAYWRMYEDNLERWGDRATSQYGREIFDFMWKLPEGRRLWLGYVGEQLACGVWAFEWRDRVVLWHAAAYGLETPMFSPPISVYTEAIRDAQERGFALFDFNPSGGNTGTDEFKRRFGTREVPVVHAAYRRTADPLTRAIRRVRHLLAR